MLPDDAWPRASTSARCAAPPVFGWLAQTGRLDDAEMLRTFNCGIGMVMVVAKADADALVRLMQEWGEAPYVIGEIVPPGGAQHRCQGQGRSLGRAVHRRAPLRVKSISTSRCAA